MIEKVMAKLEKSAVFKKFKQDKDFYLTHIFTMIEEKKEQIWQIGFYNKKKDKMIVFEVDGKITQGKEEEVFKKEKFVKKLELKEIIPYEKALEIADDLQKTEYPAEMVNRRIVILQNLDETVWNITLISMQFNIVNIKIKASDGTILKHHRESLLRFGKETL
ncbi:hypothetical protein C4573_03985 [Candidatus Woesearchaeota archaeon]|nr:MAG: hypothetical protein C4573_03985 [Candidatus Woesearchaeota archaeon]